MLGIFLTHFKMYSRFLTSSLYGLSGEQTWVEVDSDNGIPTITIVGLANQSVKEAKDRIRSAIINSGFEFPARKITINLTPANKQKIGSHYDLPMALGVLNSSGLVLLSELSTYRNGSTACFGELTLDGKLCKVDGALPIIMGLSKEGTTEFIIPKDNLKEASLVKGITLYPAETLIEVVNHITGLERINPVIAKGYVAAPDEINTLDFKDIHGQENVKRAAQIAAAGMHGLLMVGPPGVGKSMVGKRIPGILPPLCYEEQLDVTQIYSVAGELSSEKPMILERPFRAPHHSISSVSLVGGGNKPKPGEISLAHNGVLFLDELPEFSTQTLDMLRQPLEDGFVSITRVNGKVTYPSSFMLVAAMNPCKCGYYGDPVKRCTCTETDRQKYLGKVSGPLLDRIDMHIALERIIYKDIISKDKHSTDTKTLKDGVIRAIEFQNERYKGLGVLYNSRLSAALTEKYCKLNESANKVMEDAFSKWNLSARSYHRILRVARTIADIDLSNDILDKHILEALSFRMPDKYFK